MTGRPEPTQVVVLAGGAATRLGALARHTPKILQPIGNRTFLDLMVEPLVQQGFRRFHFCIGHLGEQVTQHLDEHFGHLTTTVHHDPVQRGTAGALRSSRGLLDETFVLQLGDTYLPADYKQLVTYWRRTRSTTLLVTSASCGVRPNIELDGERVARYDKVNGIPGGWVDAGAAVVERAELGLLDDLEDPIDLSVLYERLIARGSLGALATELPFWDIGTPESYARFAATVRTSGAGPC